MLADTLYKAWALMEGRTTLIIAQRSTFRGRMWWRTEQVIFQKMGTHQRLMKKVVPQVGRKTIGIKSNFKDTGRFVMSLQYGYYVFFYHSYWKHLDL